MNSEQINVKPAGSQTLFARSNMRTTEADLGAEIASLT
jgi:hypothetical protein